MEKTYRGQIFFEKQLSLYLASLFYALFPRTRTRSREDGDSQLPPPGYETSRPRAMALPLVPKVVRCIDSPLNKQNKNDLTHMRASVLSLTALSIASRLSFAISSDEVITTSLSAVTIPSRTSSLQSITAHASTQCMPPCELTLKDPTPKTTLKNFQHARYRHDSNIQ